MELSTDAAPYLLTEHGSYGLGVVFDTRELTVLRYEAVRCAKGHQVNRAVVREQLAEEEDFAFCARCGQRVALPPADTPIELTRQQAADLADQRRAASQRSRFEQVLFRVPAYVTQEGIRVPDCFISYAWGDDGHERWVEYEPRELLPAVGLMWVRGW